MALQRLRLAAQARNLHSHRRVRSTLRSPHPTIAELRAQWNEAKSSEPVRTVERFLQLQERRWCMRGDLLPAEEREEAAQPARRGSELCA